MQYRRHILTPLYPTYLTHNPMKLNHYTSAITLHCYGSHITYSNLKYYLQGSQIPHNSVAISLNLFTFVVTSQIILLRCPSLIPCPEVI